MITTIVVDGKAGFEKKIQDAFAAVDDLTIPLELIKESWFKSNRAIFALGSPGKFADLTEGYKKQKQKAVGFVYPILQRGGTLKAALTVPGAPGSIAEILGRRALQVGVDPRVDVFRYLPYGTKKMRARPYVLLGAEQVAPSEINQRVQIWTKIIVDYVIQKAGVSGG